MFTFLLRKKKMGWEARASSASQNHFLCRKDNTLDPLLEQASSFLPSMSLLSGIRIGLPLLAARIHQSRITSSL